VTGVLYGVGVGPGAPDLLTLRAARTIRAVPVVCTPRRTASAESYALAVVRDLLDLTRQELVELAFPMTRDPDLALLHRDEAATHIGAILSAGRDVAFITEGDPLLYSTFIHLYRRLRAASPPVRVEIVPGVTSVSAAAAVAGLPLADGTERLAVVPATCGYEELHAALRDFDTVALLKVSPIFDRVLDLLEELNLLESAVYVSRAGTPEQRVEADVRALREQPLDYLSLILVKTPRETEP
jgi:precorrin-2/cobalt-factor-2 C20-methyltransferase